MFWNLVKKFPPLIQHQKLQELFEQLELPTSASRYLIFGFFLFILLSIVGYFVGVPYIGIFVFLILLIYPYMLKKQEEQSILAQLPLFLIDLGSLLNMGIPLIESIELASKNTGKLEEVLRKSLDRLEKNESLTSILLSIIQRYENATIKRAFTQIIAAIETGSGSELKQLGRELLKEQIYLLKEFGNKLSIISQFFIAFNVIVPVFIVLLVMALPLIMQQKPDLNMLTQSLFIIFPMIGIIFLLATYLTFPETSFTNPTLDIKMLLIGALLAYTSLLLELNLEQLMILSGILVLGTIVWALRNPVPYKELEEEVPEALLMLSAFPRFDLEEFFEQLKKGNLKAFKEISEHVLSVLKNNQNPSDIFRFLESIDSPLFKRFVSIIKFSYYTGSGLGEKLAEWAEALFQYITAKKDIASMFMVHKYTLIIGAIIVPIILGAMVSIFYKLFKVNIEYIVPFIFIATGLTYTLLNMVQKSKVIWYFMLSLLGFVAFYLAKSYV